MDLLDLTAKIIIDDGTVAPSLKKVSSSFDKMKKNINAVVKTASKIGAVVTGVSTALAAVGVEAAAEVRAEASAFEQTFGEMQEVASAAIGRVAEDSGILQTRLNAVGSKIYAFARSAGGNATESLSLMERALQAAADSAAFYDVSVEQATETLQSFLKGNFANDAALGLSATETTRNAAAMELFGQKYNELSEIQKQETLLKMVEDSQRLSGAMGQAAREADGWENVLGNLKESWRQLKAAIGAPVLDSITPMLQDITVSLQEVTAKVDWDAFAQKVTGAFETAVSAGKKLIQIFEDLLPVIMMATGAFISFKTAMAIQSVIRGFQKAQVAISLLNLKIGEATLAQAALNGTMTLFETIVALLTGKLTLLTLAQEAARAVQVALNAAWNANPIGLIITAVGLLITGITTLWITNEGFRDSVVEIWNSIKDAVSNAVDFIGEKIGSLTGKFGDVVSNIKDLLGIHSPSRVFADIGENMALGLGNGWDSEFSAISRDITRGLDFGTASIGFGSSGIGAISNSIASGVSSVVGGGGQIIIDLTTEIDGAVLSRKLVPFNREEAIRNGAG